MLDKFLEKKEKERLKLFLGNQIMFSISDVAKLLKVSPNKVESWILDYTFMVQCQKPIWVKRYSKKNKIILN